LSTESSLKQIILIKTIAYFSTSENLKKLYETRTVVITSIEKKKKEKQRKQSIPTYLVSHQIFLCIYNYQV
jgi:hypothetical protein